MKKTESTPGPWFITHYGPLRASYQHQIGTADKTVAYTWLPSSPDDKIPQTSPEHEANARLIAAAPELLEALEAVLSGPVEQLDRTVNLSLAAIAKARRTP